MAKTGMAAASTQRSLPTSMAPVSPGVDFGGGLVRNTVLWSKYTTGDTWRNKVQLEIFLEFPPATNVWQWHGVLSCSGCQ
jgi:hypothetical protein